MAEQLAQQAMGGWGGSDLLGLDTPGEAELLEHLKDPDPEMWQPASMALRELWRNAEGPFAVDELEGALDPLGAISNRDSAASALQQACTALLALAAEYPGWAAPLNELAMLELMRAAPAESIKYARLALERQPAHFDCLARLVLCNSLQGKQQEQAAAAVSDLEAVAPGFVGPVQQLAKAMATAARAAAKVGQESGAEGESGVTRLELELDPEALPVILGLLTPSIGRDTMRSMLVTPPSKPSARDTIESREDRYERAGPSERERARAKHSRAT